MKSIRNFPQKFYELETLHFLEIFPIILYIYIFFHYEFYIIELNFVNIPAKAIRRAQRLANAPVSSSRLVFLSRLSR